MPAVSQTVMLCELSNVHLNFRDLLGKNNTSGWAFTNNILLFISYTLFRVFYFPIQINAHL